MSTYVVNLMKEKCDVFIGRSSPFGNPFSHLISEKGKTIKVESREKAIQCYARYFEEKIEKDEEFRNQVLALRGKKLGCYCTPLPCHGDVIVKWLEEH